MTTVSRISPHLDIECPKPLRNLPIWLVWRYEGGESGKPRKVPYYAGGGRRKGVQGTQQDRARLVTFDAAMAAARRGGFDGVGVAMLEGCGFVAIDFDDVVQNAAHFAAINQMLKGTYAEFSPSGNGVRGFVRDTGVFRNIKSHAREGHAYTFETFASAGFVTFTGNVLPSVELTGSVDDITPPSVELVALYNDRVAARGGDRAFDQVPPADALGYSIEELADILKRLNPSASYGEWIQIGMALHHETGGSEEGFLLWDSWSSAADNYLSTEDCLSHWSSFRRNTGSVVTIRTLLKMAKEAGASIGAPVASADDFDVVEDTPEEAAERKAKADRFTFVPIGQIVDLPSPGWIVKGIIPQADLGIIYGPSGAGKSFVMLDLAMAVARGISWHDCRVKQGNVRYIVAEGRGGFRKRIKAYGLRHGIDLNQVPMAVMETAPNFLMAEDVKAVTKAILASEGAAVVIVDTFAKVTPGANENAGEDMGKAIDNCRRIAEATGALVILVHHTGKDIERGARGWSGIRAAADFEAEVCRDVATGKRWLQITKQKDGDDDGRWGFKLEDVVVDMDEDNDPVTSCVIVPDEAPEQGRGARHKVEKLGAWEQAVIETYGELQLAGDVLQSELILRAVAKRPDAGSERDRRKNASRALRKLSSGARAMFILGDEYVTEVG